MTSPMGDVLLCCGLVCVRVGRPLLIWSADWTSLLPVFLSLWDLTERKTNRLAYETD